MMEVSTLTGKQKSHLRSLGMTLDAIVQIGKGGVTKSVITGANDAVTARELVKIKVLQNSPLEPADAIDALSKGLHAEVVHVIGRNGLVYRANPDKPVIILP
jgi:RNA-binding protein